jgi:hypothetical protein
MSVAEMKLNIIDKVSQTKNEDLLKEINEYINNLFRPTIEQIFEEAKTQYGETLKRLSE